MQLFNFSVALAFAKEGHRLSRLGWRREVDIPFIFVVPGSHFAVTRPPLLGIYVEGTTINYHSHMDMRLRDGRVVPWVCTQVDLFADDWYILEE